MVIQTRFTSYISDKRWLYAATSGTASTRQTVTLRLKVLELNYVEAIRSALAFEMARDERVMVLGRDVGRLGVSS